jgi:hypothetical protein
MKIKPQMKQIKCRSMKPSLIKIVKGQAFKEIMSATTAGI